MLETCPNKGRTMIFRVLALVALIVCRWRFPAGISIAVILRRRYGSAVLQLFRNVQKADYKLRKLRCDIHFLETCEKNGLTPKFLHFKLYNRNLQRTQHYRDYQKKLLGEEVRRKRRLIFLTITNLETVTRGLRSAVSHLDFIHLSNCIERVNTNGIDKINHVHSLKLKNLGYSDVSMPPDNVIFNLSSRVLNDEEKKLLSKGLNFAFVSKNLCFDTHFLTFERLFKVLQTHTFYNDNPKGYSYDYFKSSLKHLAMSTFYNYKPESQYLLSKDEYNILKNLAKDKSIIVMKPDKGNGIVLLDKNVYVEKMNLILSDRNKFQVIEKDPFKCIFQLEDKVNRVLNKLCNSGCFTKEVLRSLQASGSNPGRLYGLPKVHKENYPLRPILSAIGTANYDVAKFLVPILAPLTTNEHTLNDSFYFMNCLRGFDINDGYVMASFDVKSLFTQIPLDETIEICLEELFVNSEVVEGFNRSQLRELLSLATKECYFLFNGSLYKQIDGVSMGSCLGPSLANIFMCYMERKWLNDCPEDLKPLLYKRYVDDTFLVFETRYQIPRFLEYLNTKHHNIEFTAEVEENKTLSFLDIHVHNASNGISTSVFRKSTFTGLMSKFQSATPMKYKMNLIMTLVTRAYKICSSYISLHKELEFLRSILRKNGYPLNYINTYIGKQLSKLYTNDQQKTTQNVRKPIIYIPLTFTGMHSKDIKKQLSIMLSNAYPQLDIKVFFTLQNKISNFFKIKDPIPVSLQSNIIYKWQCRSCDATYVGRTIRSAWMRWFEHLGRSFRTGNHLTRPSYSAIREHSEESGHPLSLEDFSSHSYVPVEQGP